MKITEKSFEYETISSDDGRKIIPVVVKEVTIQKEVNENQGDDSTGITLVIILLTIAILALIIPSVFIFLV